MKLILLSFLVFIAGMFSIPADSYAITVGPAKMEFSADPGDIIKGSMFVMNEGSQTQTFYPTFQKFIEENGEKRFLGGEPTEVAQWFKTAASVTLGAGQQKDIPFTIELPKHAPPGGHFAAIFWSTAKPEEGLQKLSIVTRAGILVYLRVSGDINEIAQLLHFDTEGGKRFFSRLPVRFTVGIKNTGNTYIKPTGEVRLTKLFGRTKANAIFDTKDLQILPNSERNFPAQWDSKDGGGYAFGLYKAQLVLAYGEEGSELTDSMTLIMFPWQIILPSLFGLFIILWLLRIGIRRYNQWIIQSAVSTRPTTQSNFEKSQTPTQPTSDKRPSRSSTSSKKRKL